MPPGSYQFQVKACNSDGVWNESGASLAFTVQPFYWQTLWFRLLALAGLVAGVLLLGEPMSPRLLLACAAVVLGIALVNRRPG